MVAKVDEARVLEAVEDGTGDGELVFGVGGGEESGEVDEGDVQGVVGDGGADGGGHVWVYCVFVVQTGYESAEASPNYILSVIGASDEERCLFLVFMAVIKLLQALLHQLWRAAFRFGQDVDIARPAYR